MGPTEWALAVMAGLLAVAIVAVLLIAQRLIDALCASNERTHLSQRSAQNQALMFSSNELERQRIEVDAIKAEHAGADPVPKPREIIIPQPEPEPAPMDPSTWKVT